MSNAVALASASSGAIVEQVIIKGDLKELSPQERVRYYTEVCKSVGLNPLTKPFEYITLNNKLTLYALRACTDQLRMLHGVSVEELVEGERDGVFIVTAKMRNKDGRTDIAKGAVSIANLKGEALANAFMKAETKAKRRATLSLCGLGWLDETEVETIPGAKVGEPPASAPQVTAARPEAPHDPETGEVSPHAIALEPSAIEWGAKFIAAIKAAATAAEVTDWRHKNTQALADMRTAAPKAFASIERAIDTRLADLAPKPENEPSQEPPATAVERDSMAEWLGDKTKEAGAAKAMPELDALDDEVCAEVDRANRDDLRSSWNGVYAANKERLAPRRGSTRK